MRTVPLGSTGIVTPQNAFGALPIQRVSEADAVALLRRAYKGGMTFFDTARAYSNSEERVGLAFEGMRDKATIATKTMARTPEAFWADLETPLEKLRTDHVDIYQFHCVDKCYAPGDGTGMYECMLEAKAQGKISHIGVTAHKLEVAFAFAWRKALGCCWRGEGDSAWGTEECDRCFGRRCFGLRILACFAAEQAGNGFRRLTAAAWRPIKLAAAGRAATSGVLAMNMVI